MRDRLGRRLGPGIDLDDRRGHDRPRRQGVGLHGSEVLIIDVDAGDAVQKDRGADGDRLAARQPAPFCVRSVEPMQTDAVRALYNHAHASQHDLRLTQRHMVGNGCI